MMKIHENGHHMPKGRILWPQKKYDAEQKLIGFFDHKS